MKIERAKLGPCPICGREITENRKGYSCWSREDPGCGFVIWKKKAGKNAARLGRQGADRGAARVARARRGPGVGRTEKPVTGFRSRAGRTFRAKLRLEQTEEGKWRVEFDEEWAKEPPPGESEEERAEAEASGDGAKAGAAAAQAGDGAAARRPATEPRRRATEPRGERRRATPKAANPPSPRQRRRA